MPGRAGGGHAAAARLRPCCTPACARALPPGCAPPSSLGDNGACLRQGTHRGYRHGARSRAGIVRLRFLAWRGFIRCPCGLHYRPPRALRTLPDVSVGQAIDHGSGASISRAPLYTGEEVPGASGPRRSPIVPRLPLARCMEVAREAGRRRRPLLPALRLAQPGEFTQRAFSTTRWTWLQAEAVSDLIGIASPPGGAASLGGAPVGRVPQKRSAVLRDQLVQLAHAGRGDARFPEGERSTSWRRPTPWPPHPPHPATGQKTARPARQRCCARA